MPCRPSVILLTVPLVCKIFDAYYHSARSRWAFSHSQAAPRSILCRSHLTTSTLSLTNDLRLLFLDPAAPSFLRRTSTRTCLIVLSKLSTAPRISAFAIWRTEEVPSAVRCPRPTTVNAGRRSVREIVIHPHSSSVCSERQDSVVTANHYGVPSPSPSPSRIILQSYSSSTLHCCSPADPRVSLRPVVTLG